MWAVNPKVLGLVHSPSILQGLQALKAVYDLHFHPPQFPSPEAAVTLIAETQPVLILIELDELDDPRAKDWLSTVRTDSASRRIPALGIGKGQPALNLAQAMGLPLVSPEQFEIEAEALIRSYQQPRSGAPELIGRCDQPLPPKALQGLEAFNAGEYYEAHELLESAWMEESGPVRDLYRVVLQVGVGYYQVQRGNYEGARKMFLRSLQWFARLPDQCQGINLKQLRVEVEQVRTQLAALGPARMGEFDQNLLKPIPYQQSREDNHERS